MVALPTSLSTRPTYTNGHGDYTSAATSCGEAFPSGGDDSMLETSHPVCIGDSLEQLDNSFVGSEQSEHESMDINIHTEAEPSILQIQKAAARFLLTLKEQHRLTQVAINYLVSQVKEIVECIVNDVITAVEKVLVENSFVASSDDLQCFTQCYENTNPFTGLETEYRQKRFYKNHFNLVSGYCNMAYAWP